MHWIKDVIFNEDNACIIENQSASNFSILRSFAINLIRYTGFKSISQEIRLLICNIKKMWKLIGGQN